MENNNNMEVNIENAAQQAESIPQKDDQTLESNGNAPKELNPKIQELIKLVTEMRHQNSSGQLTSELCMQIFVIIEEQTLMFNEKLAADLTKHVEKIRKALKKEKFDSKDQQDSSKGKGAFKTLFKSSKNGLCFEAIDEYIAKLLEKARDDKDLEEELRPLKSAVIEDSDSNKISKKDKTSKAKKFEKEKNGEKGDVQEEHGDSKKQLSDDNESKMEPPSTPDNSYPNGDNSIKVDVSSEVSLELQASMVKSQNSENQEPNQMDSSKDLSKQSSVEDQTASQIASENNSSSKTKKSFFKKQISVDEQTKAKDVLTLDAVISKIHELTQLITEMFDQNPSGNVNFDLNSQICSTIEELTPFFNVKLSTDFEKSLSKVKKALKKDKADQEAADKQKSKTVFQTIFKQPKSGLFLDATLSYVQILLAKSDGDKDGLSEALKPLVEIVNLNQKKSDDKKEVEQSAEKSKDKKSLVEIKDDHTDSISEVQIDSKEFPSADQNVSQIQTQISSESTTSNPIIVDEQTEDAKNHQESIDHEASETLESSEIDQSSSKDKTLLKRKTSFRDKIFKKKQPSLNKQVSINEQEAKDEEETVGDETSEKKKMSKGNKPFIEKQILVEKQISSVEQATVAEQIVSEKLAKKLAEKKVKEDEKALKKAEKALKKAEKASKKEKKTSKEDASVENQVDELPETINGLSYEEATLKIQELIKMVTDMFEQNSSGQISPDLCIQISKSLEELTPFFNKRFSMDLDKYLTKVKKALKKITADSDQSEKKSLFQSLFKITKSELFLGATVLYIRTLVTKFNENPGEMDDVLKPLAELLTLEDEKALEKEKAAENDKESLGEQVEENENTSNTRKLPKKPKDNEKDQSLRKDTDQSKLRTQSSIEEQSAKSELLTDEKAILKIQDLIKLATEMFEQNKTGQIEPELCSQMYNILLDLTPYFIGKLNIDLDKYLSKMKKSLKKDIFELDLPDSSKRKQVFASIFKYTKSGVFFGTATVYFRKLIAKVDETPDGELCHVLKPLSEIISIENAVASVKPSFSLKTPKLKEASDIEENVEKSEKVTRTIDQVKEIKQLKRVKPSEAIKTAKKASKEQTISKGNELIKDPKLKEAIKDPKSIDLKESIAPLDSNELKTKALSVLMPSDQQTVKGKHQAKKKGSNIQTSNEKPQEKMISKIDNIPEVSGVINQLKGIQPLTEDAKSDEVLGLKAHRSTINDDIETLSEINDDLTDIKSESINNENNEQNTEDNQDNSNQVQSSSDEGNLDDSENNKEGDDNEECGDDIDESGDQNEENNENPANGNNSDKEHQNDDKNQSEPSTLIKFNDTTKFDDSIEESTTSMPQTSLPSSKTTQNPAKPQQKTNARTTQPSKQRQQSKPKQQAENTKNSEKDKKSENEKKSEEAENQKCANQTEGLEGNKDVNDYQESGGINRFGDKQDFDDQQLNGIESEEGSMGLGAHRSVLEPLEDEEDRDVDQDDEMIENEEIEEEEEVEEEEVEEDSEYDSDDETDYDSDEEYDSDMEAILDEYDSDDDDDDDGKKNKVVSILLKVAKKALSVALDVDI